MGKIFTYLIIVFLFTSIIYSQQTYYVSTSGNDTNTGSDINPWATIQGAINNASVVNGDIIIVKDGTYNENINVTKELTIQSENGYTATTIIAADYHYSAIYITANYVTIDGFTVYGSTSTYYTNNLASIYLGSVNNCTISNNKCYLDDSYGHNSYRSIFLRNSDNNLVSNNICSYSGWEGILLYQGSDNNEIRNNTCRYNNFGISNTSSNNILRDNIVENNTQYGVYLTGGTTDLGASSSDKGGNTFRNNTLYDVYNQTGTATNAYYNYWGSNDAATIDSHIYDDDENSSYGEVSFSPWLNKTFYVSPSGNDGNDGSEANPWATIQGAINNGSVSNGDTIIVKDGTYNENVDVTKELTIKSENGYSSTIVAAVSTGQSVFQINGINNVTIEGFTAYGATDSWNNCGVKIFNNANHCTINGNRCGYDGSHNNWKGIQLRDNADNNTISNNICKYNLEDGIQVYNGSDSNTILNNELSNNGGGYEGDGIQTDGSSISNIVRGNTIENNLYYGIRLQNNGSLNLGNNDVNDKGNNTIQNNGHYDISNATSNTINAYYNIWGSNDATTIDSHIYDNDENSSYGEVFFDPWDNSGLPVELTTFAARANKNSVLLNWQTATEVNNYGFSVERQTQESSIKNQDEIKSWENIAFVEGHGNSNSPKFYEYTDKTVNSGKYLYRLKQIDIDGGFEYSETVEADLGMPSKFELSQNYPNPFNPTTVISYSIPKSSHVSVKVFDVLGKTITTLVSKNQEVGSYKVNFDASALSTGIYFYKISAGKFTSIKKMMLIK